MGLTNMSTVRNRWFINEWWGHCFAFPSRVWDTMEGVSHLQKRWEGQVIGMVGGWHCTLHLLGHKASATFLGVKTLTTSYLNHLTPGMVGPASSHLPACHLLDAPCSGHIGEEDTTRHSVLTLMGDGVVMYQTWEGSYPLIGSG